MREVPDSFDVLSWRNFGTRSRGIYEIASTTSKVLDVVMRQDGTVGEVANSLKKLVDVSNSRAAEREQEEHPSITDDVLDVLQKDLDEMDVDAFLSKL